MTLPPAYPGGGGGVGEGTIYPLWKSDTDGGSYAINDLVNFEGNSYRNFTGTNTDTTPDNDSVNWVRIQIVTLTQAEFDALDLAGNVQNDIFYNISDATPLRIESVTTVADIAARDALSTQQEGDTVRVLDNGAGQPEMFVWDSASWVDYLPPSASYLSSGVLIKAAFSLSGTDLIISSGGVAQLYDSSAPDALLNRFPVPGETIDLTSIADGDSSQVLVRDNAGTIEYFLNTGADTDEITEALYAAVSNNNGAYDVDRFDNAHALSTAISNRILLTDRIKRLQFGGGLVVTNPNSNEIEISAGEVLVHVERRPLVLANSSVDLSLSYDGLGNSTVITGFNNTQFVDSGGNLVTLTNNRYAVNWIYRSVSDEGGTVQIGVLLGGADHPLLSAQNENAPTYKLEIFEKQAELIGKMIILKDAASPITIEEVKEGLVVRTITNINTIDYFFSYDTTTQSPASNNTWDDFDFSNNGPINGWTHTLNTAIFTCPNDGVYKATIEMTVDHSGGADRTMAMRALFNAVEIAGSHAGKDVVGTNAPDPIDRSFKFDGVAGQDLKIQFSADSAVNVMVQPGASPDSATALISATLNVERIA